MGEGGAKTNIVSIDKRENISITRFISNVSIFHLLYLIYYRRIDTTFIILNIKCGSLSQNQSLALFIVHVLYDC